MEIEPEGAVERIKQQVCYSYQEGSFTVPGFKFRDQEYWICTCRDNKRLKHKNSVRMGIDEVYDRKGEVNQFIECYMHQVVGQALVEHGIKELGAYAKIEYTGIHGHIFHDGYVRINRPVDYDGSQNCKFQPV